MHTKGESLVLKHAYRLVGENLNYHAMKNNFAFLETLISDEIKIIDSIAALISRQRLIEVLIGFIRASNFLHHHFLILNLENNKPVIPLRF